MNNRRGVNELVAAIILGTVGTVAAFAARSNGGVTDKITILSVLAWLGALAFLHRSWVINNSPERTEGHLSNALIERGEALRDRGKAASRSTLTWFVNTAQLALVWFFARRAGALMTVGAVIIVVPAISDASSNGGDLLGLVFFTGGLSLKAFDFIRSNRRPNPTPTPGTKPR